MGVCGISILQSHPREETFLWHKGKSKCDVVGLWRAPKGDRLVFVLNFFSALNGYYSEWSFTHAFTVEDMFCFFNRAKRTFPRYLTTSWEDKLAHAALPWNTLAPIHISYSCFWKGGCFHLTLIFIKEHCLEHTGIAVDLLSHFYFIFIFKKDFHTLFQISFASFILTLFLHECTLFNNWIILFS